MDILWSIGLVVFLLLALNHMAGGKPNNVLRPVGSIFSRLLGFALTIVSRLFASVLSLLGSSTKMIPPPGRTDRDGGTSEKPPPRW
jgi:hypothetical protein